MNKTFIGAATAAISVASVLAAAPTANASGARPNGVWYAHWQVFTHNLTGRVLDAPNWGLTVNDYNGGNYQHWVIEKYGKGYRIRNQARNQCAYNSGWETYDDESGTKVLGVSYGNCPRAADPNFTWTVINPSSSSLQLKNYNSGKCMVPLHWPFPSFKWGMIQTGCTSDGAGNSGWRAS